MMYREYLKKPWNSILRGKGREFMYTQQELDSIDRKYFNIILMNEHDVTLMSKNTHHMWQLPSVELPDGQIVVTFHKHHVEDQYHTHSRSTSLRRAIRDIKSHDKFQLNGRRRIKKA